MSVEPIKSSRNLAVPEAPKNSVSLLDRLSSYFGKVQVSTLTLKGAMVEDGDLVIVDPNEQEAMLANKSKEKGPSASESDSKQEDGVVLNGPTEVAQERGPSASESDNKQQVGVVSNGPTEVAQERGPLGPKSGNQPDGPSWASVVIQPRPSSYVGMYGTYEVGGFQIRDFTRTRIVRKPGIEGKIEKLMQKSRFIRHFRGCLNLDIKDSSPGIFVITDLKNNRKWMVDFTKMRGK